MLLWKKISKDDLVLMCGVAFLEIGVSRECLRSTYVLSMKRYFNRGTEQIILM
jgi:hypothetical protein